MKIYKQNAIKKAKDLRKRVGGTIFAFPINEKDPQSKYAVVVYAGGKYHVYPSASDISEAGVGIRTILEEFKKIGYPVNYEKDVRFVTYEAQVNAPDVTMKRLRDANKTGEMFTTYQGGPYVH